MGKDVIVENRPPPPAGLPEECVEVRGGKDAALSVH